MRMPAFLCLTFLALMVPMPLQAADVGAPLRPASAPEAASTPLAGPLVNPFTGMPLSLERARWALEQSRVEEQMQASLLNRRKLESERQRIEGTSSAAPGWPVLSAAAGTGAGASPSPSPSPSPAGPAIGLPAPRAPSLSKPFDAGRPGRASSAGRTRPVVPALPPPAPGEVPRIVGVREVRGQWCVLVQVQDAVHPVCSGALIQGQLLQAVSGDGYRLGGVQHALELGPIVLTRPRPVVSLPAQSTGAAEGAVPSAAGPIGATSASAAAFLTGFAPAPDTLAHPSAVAMPVTNPTEWPGRVLSVAAER